MNQINIGFIGVGYWGKNLLRALSSLPEVHLRYICDENKNQLDAIQAHYLKCKTTTNYRDILSDTNVEGVFIATPAPSHFTLAQASLKAGKHTFVEKPLSLKVEEAQELVKMAKKENRLLMVGHLLKHHPVTHYIRNLVDTGSLGEINYIFCQRVNLGVIRPNENALWSLSPHDLSLILYFSKEFPDRVTATGGSFLKPGIEDVVFASLHFPSGHLAHLHVSWLDPHKIRKITLVGSKKMVVFDDMEPREKLRIYDKGAEVNLKSRNPSDFYTIREGDIHIPKIDGGEPLKLECQNFIEALQGKAKPQSDGEEAIQILKIIKALDQSLKESGKTIFLS